MRKETAGARHLPSAASRAPDARAEREWRMRRALAGTPVTVFSQDCDLRYDWVFNPHPAFDEHAVLGKSDGDLVSASSAHALTEVKRAVLATGEPRRARVRVEPLAGGPHAIYDLHVEPLTDDAGTVTGVLCAAVDVSHLCAEAAAARRAEARFRAAVEAMMDSFGIYSAVRDEAGRIVDFRVEYVNEAACRTNSMSREDQLGKLLCEILPEHRENGLFEAYCHLVDTGEPIARREEAVEGEWAGRRLVRAFDIVATRHDDGFVACWRDVTVQRSQELELAAALSESDLLRQELEHRVGNNLQILSALIGMAARKAEPAAAEALRGARRKVELLGSLQKTLRATTGRHGTISLTAFLGQICEAVRTGLELELRQIALEFECGAAKLGANEAIMLGLLVNELVTNAAKHAFAGRTGGRIRVILAEEGGTIALTVSDDGNGIDPEAVAASDGAGRHLMDRLAAALGAELVCETSAGGTTFRMVLHGAAAGTL